MNKLHLFASACAYIITQIISTPVLSASIFPSEIQTCVSTSICSNPALVQQAPTFSTYSYLDGGVSKFLFKYSLSPSSSESTNFSTTPLSGAAWLSANATYDLSQERHLFSLYLDGVTPTPTNLWVGDSDGLDVGLSMSTPDLLAGRSFFRMVENQRGGESFLKGDLGTHGDQGPIFNNHDFVICLAEGCEVGAELNLLNMQYLQSGSTAQLIINTTDQRGLLYNQYRDDAFGFDDTWYLSQSYKVVPIPPAVWLFGSGLLGLIGFARRKKS